MADIAPGLDELAVAVAAPSVLLTDPAGPVHADGVQGWYVDDVRLLRHLEAQVSPAGSATVRVVHELAPDALTTTIEVSADSPATVRLDLTVAADLAPVAVVRQQQETAEHATPDRRGRARPGPAKAPAAAWSARRPRRRTTGSPGS